METRININYTPSKTSEVFGLFTLSFQGSDGKIHSVNTKFNPKQLWEFSRDTSSVAFDLLVLSMIVYNVDRAVLRLSNSDDGWKRNLILLNVPVINLEDMNKGREAFNKAINFLTGDNWDIHFIQADSYSYNPTKKVKEYDPQFFDNKHQKRNRDFNALLYFLKNRMNERTIRQELFFNGIIEKQELDEYTSLALHSYRQVINWLKKKATNEIQIRAGI